MKAQRILRASTVVVLKQRAASDHDSLELYASAASFPGIVDADLLNTAVAIPDSPPTLVMSSGNIQDVAATDCENAILLYNYLPGLSRTQAADSRLWVTLAHTTFWDYVRARWGEDDRSRLRTAVLRHWFVPEGGSKAALRTQAISRLWWAAHLTYAPWEGDPQLSVFETADKFHFTRVLLKRQQIYFDLVERDYGSDLRLRTCILDALDRYLPSVSWKDGLSRESSKRLNLLLKHQQVASLDVGRLRKACDILIATVAAELGDAGSSQP
jgi:hypothetical protein